MIIGVDGRVFQEREPTGVTRYSFFFIEELGRRYSEARFVIFLAGTRNFTPPEFSHDLLKRITWVRWRMPHLFFNIISLVFRYPKLDRWLFKKIGQSLDLLVLPNLHFAAVSSSVKLLMVVHDLSFLHEPRWYSFKSRLWHYLAMKQGLWQRASLLVCVSKMTALDLQKTFDINYKKISIVSYVIPTWSRNSPSPPLNLRGGTMALPLKVRGRWRGLCLAIGRVGQRKNITGLIEGLGEWLSQRDLHLTIIGPSDQKLKNNPKITFTGYTSETRKQELLSQTALLFEVSFFEGIGLPLLETDFLPQVVSHTTSLPEYAPPQAILINPYDLAEYPQAVQTSLAKK